MEEGFEEVGFLVVLRCLVFEGSGNAREMGRKAREMGLSLTYIHRQERERERER